MDLAATGTEDDIEVVEAEQLVVSLTNDNTLLATKTNTLYTQSRTGKGVSQKLKKGQYLVTTMNCTDADILMLFTADGQYYTIKAADISVGVPYGLPHDAIAVTVLSKAPQYIVFATAAGLIKKSETSLYRWNARPTKAIQLGKDDQLISVMFGDDNDNVGILSSDGNLLIRPLSGINAIGRVTQGVQGIKLSEGASAVAAHIVPPTTQAIVSLSDSHIKQTAYSEFPIAERAGKGAKAHKTENAKDFLPLGDKSSHILIITDTTTLKVPTKEIPSLGRLTQGVKTAAGARALIEILS